MKRKICLGIMICLILCILGFGFYVSNYYHAKTQKIEAYQVNKEIDVLVEDGNYIFMPEEVDSGFIFYPGGKVEAEAYIPLLKEIASQNVLCVLIDMPFNLAVFDINAANDVLDDYSDGINWYIGGHSLGGAMAASYAAKQDQFKGLVLLGAYSTADLTQSDLDVLSIYGSEDQVLNVDKYESNLINLPKDYEEIMIEGGCHAYFGMYGAQEGDGTPTISNDKQIQMTAEAITAMIKGNKL